MNCTKKGCILVYEYLQELKARWLCSQDIDTSFDYLDLPNVVNIEYYNVDKFKTVITKYKLNSKDVQ